MRESIKKNLKSRHNDLYVLENDIPIFLARPAVNAISSFEKLGLNRADLRLYVVELLLAERHCWCQEPDELMCRNAFKLMKNSKNGTANPALLVFIKKSNLRKERWGLPSNG